MTLRTGSSPRRTAFDRIQAAMPWILTGIVGIGVIFFFSYRSDSLKCNSDYNAAQSRAINERTERTNARALALEDVASNIRDGLNQPIPPLPADIASDLDAFIAESELQRMKVEEFPYPAYSDFCGGDDS